MRRFGTRVLNALVVLVVLAALATVAGCDAKSSGPSPARVAGLYVKGLAARAGVTIVGDKVWSVRKVGDEIVVVVRVRYRAQPTFLGQPIGPPTVGVTTIYVREIKSDYQVVG